MAHDVFISYSSKDKPIADGICANLEGAGIRCWIAPRDITPGQDWPSAIDRAISQSRVMVLVFSANVNSSEHIPRELSLAANSKLAIIPFKIENIEPEPGIRYFLTRTHWLDAINPPTQEQIRVLVDCVKALIQVSPPAEASLVASPVMNQPALVRKGLNPQPTPGKKPAMARYLWISGSLLLLLLLTGWVILTYVTHTFPALTLAWATATATETATETETLATAIPIPATLTPIPTPIVTQIPAAAISIAGQWFGNAHHNDDPKSEWKFGITILARCEIGQVCGTYSAPEYPCSGNLTLEKFDGNIYVFSETRTGGLDLCPSNNFEFMQLVSPNQLLVTTGPDPDSTTANTSALLTK